MGLPSGTFTHPADGRLQVVFDMRALVDSAEWAGGTWNIVLRCRAGSLSALISATNPTATIEQDYTASSSVAVSIEYVDHTFDGIGQVAANLLTISCHLRSASASSTISFDGLLSFMRQELLPMSGTVQPQVGDDDTYGDEWFVRPLSALAVNFKDPTPAGLGFLNDLGRATITDIDGEQIWEQSCVAWGYATIFDTNPIRLTCTVLPGGTQVRLSGGVDAEGNILALRWSLTYYSAPAGDGTSYATAWAGFNNIVWASLAPGDSLFICGLHDNSVLSVGASGAAGAWLKIRLDYAVDPGTIYKSSIVADVDWVVAPNGEFALAGVTTANNMVFEDGRRMSGPSTTSQCKARVYVVDAAANTLEVAGERPIFTGMPVHFPKDVAAAALPAGLAFAPDRGEPYYAILVGAVTGGRYLIRVATSLANALAGTAVDFTSAGSGDNLFMWIVDDTHVDHQPGELEPGEFAWDPITQTLYYKPSTGTPADHEVRLSNDKSGDLGSCIYAVGRSYLRIMGGGQYGGLFATATSNPQPAPLGRVGLAHLNAIYIEGGTRNIVDGLDITGSRSGVVFTGSTYPVGRNCRVTDVGWHAMGGETVTTAEPNMLLERNWIRDVGLGHDFGDLQGLVTNPLCHNTIMRRNFIQRCGRDNQYVNTGAMVVDSSANVQLYRNWIDQTEGEVVEMGSGPDGNVTGALVISNIVTRSGTRLNGTGVRENARQCFFGSFCAGTSSIIGSLVAGNLVANSRFLTGAVFPSEPTGVVLLRTAATTSVNNGHEVRRNALFNIDGNAYAIKTTGSTTPTPEFTADENLFVRLTAFFKRDVATSGGDITYAADRIQGTSAGYWSFDTGNDVASRQGDPNRVDFAAPPTTAQLEFLRQDDQYDTTDVPTLASVGRFPLISTL